MSFRCPDCHCNNYQESIDSWFTCENCNESFTEQEISHPSPTKLENLIKAVETLIFEVETYGHTKYSLHLLRNALKEIKI